MDYMLSTRGTQPVYNRRRKKKREKNGPGKVQLYIQPRERLAPNIIGINRATKLKYN